MSDRKSAFYTISIAKEVIFYQQNLYLKMKVGLLYRNLSTLANYINIYYTIY